MVKFREQEPLQSSSHFTCGVCVCVLPYCAHLLQIRYYYSYICVYVYMNIYEEDARAMASVAMSTRRAKAALVVSIDFMPLHSTTPHDTHERQNIANIMNAELTCTSHIYVKYICSYVWTLIHFCGACSIYRSGATILSKRTYTPLFLYAFNNIMHCSALSSRSSPSLINLCNKAAA